MDVIEEKIVGKYQIKVVLDDYPENPRNWENLSKMVCFHKRYNLGDRHDYNSDGYYEWSEIEKAIVKNEKPVVIKPIYLYDHSGITINTTGFNCGWDSGKVGFVFITREAALKEFGGKRITPEIKKRCEEIIDGEIDIYDKYIRGECYGYIIEETETCNLGHTHLNMVDSCYGYYNSDECMVDAEYLVDSYE